MKSVPDHFHETSACTLLLLARSLFRCEDSGDWAARRPDEYWAMLSFTSSSSLASISRRVCKYFTQSTLVIVLISLISSTVGGWTLNERGWLALMSCQTGVAFVRGEVRDLTPQKKQLTVHDIQITAEGVEPYLWFKLCFHYVNSCM